MINPLGGSTARTFERASQGHSGIDYLRRFDTSGLPCGSAESCRRVDSAATAAAAVQLEPLAPRAIRLAWAAGMEAAEQAKLDLIRIGTDRRESSAITARRRASTI
jgi:3-oxoacyl-(acyl-carrier-protein) synthase